MLTRNKEGATVQLVDGVKAVYLISTKGLEVITTGLVIERGVPFKADRELAQRLLEQPAIRPATLDEVQDMLLRGAGSGGLDKTTADRELAMAAADPAAVIAAKTLPPWAKDWPRQHKPKKQKKGGSK